MNEARISRAKANFKQYLAESLLKKEDFNKDIFGKLYENSLESLKVAEALYSNKTSFLWTIVSSYYAMFYIASAFIYKKGYKAQHKIVHKVICDSLIALGKDDLEEKFLEEYEEEKDKALTIADQMLDSYEHEMSKRAGFQYEMSWSIKESKANTSLNRAKEFVAVFRELLER